MGKDSNNEMDDIVQDFLIEADELLEDLDEKLIELEKKPYELDLLNDVFRSIHTIKGTSGFLGYNQIVELTHQAENLLNLLRQGKKKLTPSIMDVILQTVDILRVLLENVKNGVDKEEEIKPVIEKLTSVMTEDDKETTCEGQEGSAPKMLGDILKEIDVAKEEEIEEALLEQKKGQKKVGQMLIGKGKLSKEDLDEALKEQKEGKKKLGEVLLEKNVLKEDDLNKVLLKQKESKGVQVEQTMRVDIKRLDDVMNMIGELVLGRNRLMKLGAKLEEEYGEDTMISTLRQTISELDVIATDLQIAVMKTRMQPVARVFNRFPRMVRDLSRAKGKEVELILSGEETELDKTVIEAIGDPLVHLIRNAIDHGIETPEEREKTGKTRKAALTLSAFHKGGNIFITVGDDGRGIDLDKIKERALEKGLSTEEEIEMMTDKELMNFIFHPGFSTASEVTDISGRGVGMDVVRNNITAINGYIDVDSTPGRGTKISLRLPLTLAIIQALIVRICNEDYAIPLSTVVEIIRVDSSEIQIVDSKEVILSRGQVYPVLRLSFLLGVEGDDGTSGYAVIVACGKKMVALLVERLLGQEEIVVKSMGGYISNIPGISGATITGDGRVILILDVSGLLSHSGKGENTPVFRALV